MPKILSVVLLLFIAIAANAQPEELVEYVQQGVELHDKGDYEGAIENFKKALKIDKKSPLANYEIANTYFTIKEYKTAIKHADKVIDEKGDYVDNAYVLKGSAQDLMGKPKEAIKTYQKALKDYPENYLLHYNLALTATNSGELKIAEEAAIGAIKVKSNHGSSHYLLGVVMGMQGKRVQSLLALYNFLLIEPNTPRSEKALEMLNEKLSQGVKKTGENSISISITSLGDTSDAFGAAELTLGLLQATRNLDDQKGLTEQESFVKQTESFFKIMGELKKENHGFWWDFYVSFFYEIAKKNHAEAFSYYILQSGKEEAVNNWLKENKAKIDGLSKWISQYDRAVGE